MQFEYDVTTNVSREKVLGDGYMLSETGDLTIWEWYEYDTLNGPRRMKRTVIVFSARYWCAIQQKDGSS